MWPFSKKYTILDSGILDGFTDYHSHILPGVDDGIRSMNDAIAVLKYYEEIGVKKVWLTPHIMEDIPNTPEKLRERFEELTEYYHEAWKAEGKTPKLELCLSAENMIDALFVKRLEQGNVMPYGDKGTQLLVETSYVQPPTQFQKILQEIRAAGYTPVLAHPERYRYMEYENYETLRAQGVLFQLNVMSLAGAYGKEAKESAEWLLEDGFYSYRGTDLHNLSYIQKTFNTKVLHRDVMEMLQDMH